MRIYLVLCGIALLISVAVAASIDQGEEEDLAVVEVFDELEEEKYEQDSASDLVKRSAEPHYRRPRYRKRKYYRPRYHKKRYYKSYYPRYKKHYYG